MATRDEKMQESLDFLAKKFGKTTVLKETPPIDFAMGQAVLPPIIEEIWRDHGLAALYGGRLMLCNPGDMAPVVKTLFADDPDFDPEKIHVYAYSAFGKLIAWDQRHWSVEIDLLDGFVTCYGLLAPDRNRNTETAVLVDMSSFENIDLDWEDDEDKALFARTKKALGPLSYGECYGFFPAIALGGPQRLENLSRVRAVEHFAMLAQMQEFHLRDYLARPITNVRRIGPQR